MFSALPVLAVYSGNAANAAASVFPIAKNGQPIRFTQSHDIKVARLTIATGAVTLLAEGADYTIAGGPLAGAVTLLAGPLGSGYGLAIYRDEPFSQPFKLTLPSTAGDNTPAIYWLPGWERPQPPRRANQPSWGG